MLDGEDALRIVPCGIERVHDVHRLTQAAFAPYRRLDPPSGAVSETVAGVIEALTAGEAPWPSRAARSSAACAGA